MNRHSRHPQSQDLQAPDLPADSHPPDRETATVDLSTLAGYRVLRKLSSDDRADVYLGHSAVSRSESVVAVTVFRAGVDAASVERELSALEQCPAGCLPRLIDVATLPDGRVVLVSERLEAETVGSLLLRRRRLSPGEAVTLLAPVVVAVAALHAAGFVHGALSQGTVGFASDGRPTLTGLGGLRDLPPFGARRAGTEVEGGSRLDLVRADYARMTTLIRGVFDHLAAQTPAARQAEYLAAWFEGATSAVPFEPCLEELERRLFEWAPALPVDHQAEQQALPRDAPGRVGPVPAWDGDAVGPRVDDPEAPPPAESRSLPRWLGILHLPSDLAPALRGLDGNPRADGVEGLRQLPERLRQWPEKLRRWPERVRRWGERKRRAVVVSGCLAATISVLALTLLPQDGTDPSRRSSPQVSSTPSGRPGPPVPAPPVIDSDARTAIDGDDPVMAIHYLLAARAACLQSAGTLECLGEVDQADSPLLALDRHSVGSVQPGGTGPAYGDYRAFTAVLLERTGNAALLSLTPASGAPVHSKPASFLVIKGEAGWRLREIFEAADGPE